MPAPFSTPLNIAAGEDFQSILTFFASDLAQVDLTAATSVVMSIYITPEDAAPLVTLSTTSGPEGVLTLGPAPPVPVGLFATGQAVLASLGTAAFLQNGILATVVDTVANVAALEVLDTTSYVLSNVVFVTDPVAGSGYYQWSLGDTRTPNGTTIVAGNASTGNWLLCGSLTIDIVGAATALLAGYSRAESKVVVTWADSTTSLVFAGPVYIGQPVP